MGRISLYFAVIFVVALHATNGTIRGHFSASYNHESSNQANSYQHSSSQQASISGKYHSPGYIAHYRSRQFGRGQESEQHRGNSATFQGVEHIGRQSAGYQGAEQQRIEQSAGHQGVEQQRIEQSAGHQGVEQQRIGQSAGYQGVEQQRIGQSAGHQGVEQQRIEQSAGHQGVEQQRIEQSAGHQGVEQQRIGQSAGYQGVEQQRIGQSAGHQGVEQQRIGQSAGHQGVEQQRIGQSAGYQGVEQQRIGQSAGYQGVEQQRSGQSTGYQGVEQERSGQSAGYQGVEQQRSGQSTDYQGVEQQRSRQSAGSHGVEQQRSHQGVEQQRSRQSAGSQGVEQQRSRQSAGSQGVEQQRSHQGVEQQRSGQSTGYQGAGQQQERSYQSVGSQSSNQQGSSRQSGSQQSGSQQQQDRSYQSVGSQSSGQQGSSRQSGSQQSGSQQQQDRSYQSVGSQSSGQQGSSQQAGSQQQQDRNYQSVGSQSSGQQGSSRQSQQQQQSGGTHQYQSVEPAVAVGQGHIQNNPTQTQGSVRPAIKVYSDLELCSDCDVRNGVGYNAHPDDCNKYSQCFPVAANVWRAVVRSCPAGLFWDQSKLTCNRPHTVACAQDRCLGVTAGRQYYSDSCRGYWNCRDGKTDDLEWCGPFKSFNDDTDDCDDDRSCVDDDDEDNSIVVAAPCHYEEHETDEEKYYVYEWGQRRAMGCPPGTRFAWNKCGCGSFIQGYGTGCRPELYLPFDGDFEDKAGGNWVDNRGCITRAVAGANGGRAAYFDGNCKLIIPRFSAHDFGHRVLIRLRYKEDDDDRPSRLQTLVSNGDCNKVPSILLAYDRQGQKTEAVLRTGVRGEYTNQVTHSRGIWKEVEYEYDGNSFVLRVNNQADGGLARDNIRVVQSALHIGDGAGLANFKGYIDDVRVYLCNP